MIAFTIWFGLIWTLHAIGLDTFAFILAALGIVSAIGSMDH